MTLPTFLGIGVPRAGTTWLHDLLTGHPDVCVPMRRKEVNFFDKFFDRGIKWYARFFPDESEAVRYRAIGEITPHYFFCSDCPERIAQIPSITKFILLLRNPTERAYSYYKHIAPIENYTGFFEDFLQDCPEIIQEGFYSQYLENYLHYFRLDQMLVLIYERALADVPRTKEQIAGFLEIDPSHFPFWAGERVINKGYNPRFRSAYAFAAGIDCWLRKNDLDWIVNLAMRLGIKKLFRQGQTLPPMQEKTRQYLEGIYESEIRELELLLQTDLSCWK